jgi:hypothetical protein
MVDVVRMEKARVRATGEPAAVIAGSERTPKRWRDGAPPAPHGQRSTVPLDDPLKRCITPEPADSFRS